MTSTARPITVDTKDDSARATAGAHRLAAVAVAATVVLLELAASLVRRDWLIEAAFGWSVVVGGAAFVLGLLLGGYASDRIGPRAAFSAGAAVALASLTLSVALPVGAAATGFIAFTASAATMISGLLALTRSVARPALAIALVLGVETVLALVIPGGFQWVAGTERPGVMMAGLVLSSIAAAWMAVRCLPLDGPITTLRPTAFYDLDDLEALGRARLLGIAGVASAAIVIGERVSGAAEQGPSTAAIVACLALIGAAALTLRTRLLSAVDLRQPFEPMLIAVVSIAVILSFGVGLHDVVTRTVLAGNDPRLATLAPLAGLALAALAIDAGFSRRSLVAIAAIIATAGAHSLMIGLGVIDAPALGGLIPIAASGAGAALAVLPISDVAARAPDAITGATMGIALTALSFSEALGWAANANDDAGFGILDSEIELGGSTSLIAGTGAIICVASAAILWRRSLSR